MTPEQEQDINDTIKEFAVLFEAKYRKGQAEHGGDIWKKKDLIDKAIEEVLDQFAYLRNIKRQLQERGIVLGELDES